MCYIDCGKVCCNCEGISMAAPGMKSGMCTQHIFICSQRCFSVVYVLCSIGTFLSFFLAFAEIFH